MCVRWSEDTTVMRALKPASPQIMCCSDCADATEPVRNRGSVKENGKRRYTDYGFYTDTFTYGLGKEKAGLSLGTKAR